MACSAALTCREKGTDVSRKNVKVGLTLPLEPGTVSARLEPLRVTPLRSGKSPSVARRRSEMPSVASFSSISIWSHAATEPDPIGGKIN
jgi:hypothetical protein